ncbi:MAG TPA: hypothetical protein VGD45_20720 [Steroidobacter sp.]|uniref:hypothetical protein n=1 Tax=Steroidobacter sp. TaxID=1978227 RepID=UPI002ED86189
MNGVPAEHAFELSIWVLGGLLALLATLVGIIYRHLERRHDEHDAAIKWLRENHVSKDTLERVERTFRDAVDDMVEQRQQYHQENRDAMRELKESVTGIHRRIDEEFRFRNGGR